MRRITFLIVLLSCFVSTLSAETYRVAIKPAPPFSYKEQGKWTGISVDLLNKILEPQQTKVEFVETDSVPDLLNLVKENKVDMAIGAISMTPDREQFLDFSHPYFTTTQGILSRQSQNTVWFVAQRVITVLGIFVIGVYLLGAIVTHLDPDDDIDNIHKGAWFILTTFTTVGYGDYVPKNATAKFFVATLMIASLFLVSIFTGYMSSAMTVKKLSNITTPQSLYGKRVLTIKGTTGEEYLNMVGIDHSLVNNVQEGIKRVQSKKADAFIYDKALLDFLVRMLDNMQVSSIDSKKEQYGFAFPSQSSKLREKVNIAILNVLQTPEWKKTLAEYFN